MQHTAKKYKNLEKRVVCWLLVFLWTLLCFFFRFAFPFLFLLFVLFWKRKLLCKLYSKPIWWLPEMLQQQLLQVAGFCSAGRMMPKIRNKQLLIFVNFKQKSNENYWKFDICLLCSKTFWKSSLKLNLNAFAFKNFNKLC